MKTIQRRQPSVLGVMACIGIASVASADDTAMDRATELLQPFKTNLKVALLQGLEAGPEQAIEVCKDSAPAIAEELSVGGVVMGRSSHRLRNPSNEAPDWVVPIMKSCVDAGSDCTAVAVELSGERVGYVEPIMMQPLCQVCHGSAVAPDVRAVLEREYPMDQATGFEVGELRGVFWAEFPVSGAAPSE